MKIESKIKLTPDDVRRILLEHVEKETGIVGDLTFDVREVTKGGGDVFWSDKVFDGVTITSQTNSNENG